ncbi:MAG: hypothetical protein ACX930_04265 [Erythrobacter sp.]
MGKFLVLAAVLPIAACGIEASDRAALSEAELQARTPTWKVDFGDDSGEWTHDGECDDPRFRGPGMTPAPVIDEDRFADATDCREAYERGDLALIS